MCGRFASARKRAELLEEFGVQRDRSGGELRPDYNVAPTKPVYAVLTRRPSRHDSDTEPGGGPQEGDKPERQLRVVRWGLVPSWAKDPAIGSRMINARSETLADKPAFRQAFARRRCLLPADGFYEWQQVEQEGRKRKQPYYIRPAGGGSLAFAGLYELWRDRAASDDDPAAWLWTATIITTTAQDQVGQIHDRMPMIIEPGSWQDWLDPAITSPAELHPLLVPATVGGLEMYPVSTAVNNVRNNGSELTEPLPRQGAAEPPGGVPAGSGGTLF